jgi:ribosomal protein L13
MLRGRVLIDSLRVGAELAVPDLRVRRLGREDVSASASPTQPKIWGFLDFEAPDERAGELAAALAAALLSDDGWYSNFEVGDEHVVVFADKIFRYATGDRAAHREAVAYALAAGTPKHQIDWGE